MPKLFDLIVKSAGKGLELQAKNGSMPPGHNGPWNDRDTPVRTTAHWAMTFFRAFEISGESRLREATIVACNYLLSKEARPHGYTFYCRKPERKKAMCNGLIGQAWAVEPLLVVGRALKHQPYMNAAEEVLALHPYCEKRHCWSNVEIDGTAFSNDTYNQQVWFAAMSLLAGEKNLKLRSCALDFFKHLSDTIKFLDRGLIKHRYASVLTMTRKLRSTIGRQVRFFFAPRAAQRERNSLLELSNGYLTFLLYGIAMVEDYYPHSVCSQLGNKQLIRDAVNYIQNRYPFYCLGENRYAWTYNPVGIEMAYVLQVFGAQLEMDHTFAAMPERWLRLQFQHYYDTDRGLMDRNAVDPIILAARLYEATRLRNYSLMIGADSANIG
jgi:hypothetical protein